MLQCHNRYQGPMNGARRARQWVLRVVTTPPGQVRMLLLQRRQCPHHRRKGLGRSESNDADWVANKRPGLGNTACWHEQRGHEGGGCGPWRWPRRLRSKRQSVELNAGVLPQPEGGQAEQVDTGLSGQLGLAGTVSRTHTCSRASSSSEIEGNVGRKSGANRSSSRSIVGERRRFGMGNEQEDVRE